MRKNVTDGARAEKMQALRLIMYVHIVGHNKYFTEGILENFTFWELLSECHPEDRDSFDTQRNDIWNDIF